MFARLRTVRKCEASLARKWIFIFFIFDGVLVLNGSCRNKFDCVCILLNDQIPYLVFFFNYVLTFQIQLPLYIKFIN